MALDILLAYTEQYLKGKGIHKDKQGEYQLPSRVDRPTKIAADFYKDLIILQSLSGNKKSKKLKELLTTIDSNLNELESFVEQSRFIDTLKKAKQDLQQESVALDKALEKPLDETYIPSRPARVSKNDVLNNGKLLDDAKSSDAIKLLEESKEGRIAKSKSIPYTLIKLEDPITHEMKYYAIYKGKQHNKQLGEGAFGVTKLMQDLKTGEWHVIKIQKKEKYFAAIEADYMTTLAKELSEQTPRIIGRYERTEIGKEHYIIGMGLAPGKDLLSLANSNTELHPHRWLQIATCAARAIQEVHQAGLWHCDIKPENMMCDPVTGKVTLLDLGLAIKKNLRSGIRGTPGYIAPEIYEGYSSNEKTEVFALGKTIGDLLGLTNFIKVDKNKYIIELLETSAIFEKRIPDPAARKEIKELLKKMTDDIDDNRPNLNQAMATLNKIQENMKDNNLEILGKCRRAGILDIDEYQNASPRIKAAMIAELKNTDEVKLFSTNKNDVKTKTVQYIKLMEELRDQGLHVNSKVLHGKPNDTRTNARELVELMPAQLNLETNNLVWEYAYITAKNLNKDEQTKLKSSGVACIDGPSPKSTIEKQLTQEIQRLNNKYGAANIVVNRRVERIQAFISDMEIDPTHLVDKLKKLEKEMRSTSHLSNKLSNFEQKSKVANKLLSWMSPATTGSRKIEQLINSIKDDSRPKFKK